MYCLFCNVIKKNRMSYYYKTNNFDLIRLFCLLVEGDGNTSHVADKIQKNRTTVVNKIECLEDELKISLFKRIQGRPWILTKKGKEYYEKEAKDMVIAADKLFRHETTPKVEPKCEDDLIKETNQHVANAVTDKIEIINAEITQKIDHVGSKIGNILKVKNIIIGFACIIFVVSCAVFGYYLYKTNYFFDKKIQNIANPLLQEIMIKGHKVISKDSICPFETTQINIDMYDLLEKLTAEKQYKNISAISFMVAEHPIIAMRFSGDEAIDSYFNDPKNDNCNISKTYNAMKKGYQQTKNIFEKNKNFKIYNIYYKPENTWANSKYFFDNIQKYPNQLFGIKIKETPNIIKTRGWIIKYGDYYYLESIVNINTTYNYLAANSDSERNQYNQNKGERHIFWQKLALNELMYYDHGFYWNIIKQYGITF